MPAPRTPATRPPSASITVLHRCKARLAKICEAYPETVASSPWDNEHLSLEVAGKLLVIWDGAPIHRSRVVKEYLSNGAAQRIHLEQLPGYAPELNPAEGIWNYLKRVELKNLCCQSISHLNYELRKATDRLRHKTRVIQGCIAQPGFY